MSDAPINSAFVTKWTGFEFFVEPANTIDEDVECERCDKPTRLGMARTVGYYQPETEFVCWECARAETICNQAIDEEIASE